MRWIFRHPWISAAAVEALTIVVMTCALRTNIHAFAAVYTLLAYIHFPAILLAGQLTEYCSSRDHVIATVTVMMLFWVALISAVDLIFRSQKCSQK